MILSGLKTLLETGEELTTPGFPALLRRRRLGLLRPGEEISVQVD